MASRQTIEALFPNLKRPNCYQQTSPATPSYNCIAWAAGESHRYWWPDQMRIGYWPKSVPRLETIEAFIAAFETLRYRVTDSAEFEYGYERIAIYALSGVPTHAARQLGNGRWTSKLGEEMDIEHDLSALDGSQYGTPVVFMKRQKLAIVI